MTVATSNSIPEHLGSEADALLGYSCTGIKKDQIHALDPTSSIACSITDRPAPVLRNFQTMMNHGRLGGTGYMSILPVDQGIEHSCRARFRPNPIYFDPEKIVELAYEGGCNAVASTLGVLGSCPQVGIQDPVHGRSTTTSS